MGIGNPVIKFTELLRGAAPRNLVFPCNDQFEGPFWLENGTVIEYKSGQTSDATRTPLSSVDNSVAGALTM